MRRRTSRSAASSAGHSTRKTNAVNADECRGVGERFLLGRKVLSRKIAIAPSRHTHDVAPHAFVAPARTKRNQPSQKSSKRRTV
jgi:hypothetical protein